MSASSIAAPTRRSYPNLLLNGGLVVAAAVFLWQLPYFARGGGDAFLINVWYHGYVFVWLLVITALGRTLPLRVLATAFFLGLFVSIAVALAIGFPLGDALGTRNRLFDSFLVPGIEEAAKGLPILLYFWFLTRRSAWQPSMTDGLLMGFLAGAGFALHEDAMFDRSFGSGFGVSDLTFIFPTINDERLIGDGRDFGFYHAQWSALIGLSIGAAFFFRQRFRLSWLIPVAVLIVVWLDHARVNYIAGELAVAIRGGGGSQLLGTLTLDGRLPAYLLLAGIVAAIATEVTVLRRMGRRDYLFKGISLATLLSWLRSGGVAGLRRVQAAREYIRARRAVHYALWAAGPRGLSPALVTAMGLMLMRLGMRAGLTFAEPGVEAEPAPAPAPPSE
jgi:RsiW-degrading membrane proteinase PrsW (M82 family)